MDRKAIINKVNIKLNEVIPLGEELEVIDTSALAKPLDIMINDILDEATETLLLLAPIHHLNVVRLTPKPYVDDNTEYNIRISDDNVATVILPKDYVRLSYIMFPCWRRPVTNFYNQNDYMAVLQKNIYLRAKYDKPVVVLVKNDKSKYFECYSVEKTNANLTGFELFYVNKQSPESISDLLIPVLVSIAAVKVATIINKQNIVAILNEEIKGLINALNQ